MARIKHQETIRRTQVASRDSRSPELVVHADQSAAGGYQGLSRVAISALGRVTEVAQQHQALKAVESTDAGALARMEADVTGQPAAGSEQLADQNAHYRRGYLKADAAIRVRDWQADTVKILAQAEPGTDVEEILQARSAELMEAPEFQDPAVKRALAPALMKAQDNARAAWQKIELGEIFERQTESLTEMARQGIKDGSLLSAEGREQLYTALDSEEYAYLNRDDVDKILAGAIAEELASGDVDPAQVLPQFEQKRPDGSPGLMNTAHGESLQRAAEMGQRRRAAIVAEQQSAWLADNEFQLRDMIDRGHYSRDKITAIADQVGLEGKERLSFLRHWDNQWEQELAERERQAAEAERHRQTMAMLSAGLPGATDAQLRKAAEKDWRAAIESGNTDSQAQVIRRYTERGVVIPQLQDLLGRTTRSTLTNNYRTYEALSKIDPLVADRYLSDENATLFAQYHDAITRFGMSPQEALDMVPTGANKGRRPEVASAVGKASTAYFRDNPEVREGIPRPQWFEDGVKSLAINQALANPDADPDMNLKVAERRMLAGTITVNGRLVQRGGARDTAVPAIEDFVKRAAQGLAEEGEIDDELVDGFFAAPHPDDPNVFLVMQPSGFPAVNPRTGRHLTFDPRELEVVQHEYANERAAAEAKHKASKPRSADFMGVDVNAAASARTSKGTGPTPGVTPKAPSRTRSKDDFDFPDFIDFYAGRKAGTKPQD